MTEKVIAHQTPNGEIFVLVGKLVSQVQSVPYNVFLYELGVRGTTVPDSLIPQKALKKVPSTRR